MERPMDREVLAHRIFVCLICAVFLSEAHQAKQSLELLIREPLELNKVTRCRGINMQHVLAETLPLLLVLPMEG